MKRVDPIAVLALLLAAVALYLGVRRPDGREAPPPPPDTHVGELFLVPQGATCKLDRKTPDPIRVHDGDLVFWTVHNGCDRDATLEVAERGRKAGQNSTQVEDPLTAVLAPVIPANTSHHVIQWLVKRQEDLKPTPGTARDTWTFRWRLNNAIQQDPEIEIEYRRARSF